MTDGSDRKDGDVTPGGSRIVEGAAPESGWIAPDSYADNYDLIEDHLKPHLGEPATVFHEIISHIVHLDVLVYPPNKDSDFWVYVTSGMGDKRMATPPEADAAEWARSELMIALPREWGQQIADLGQVKSGDTDSTYWPIGLLKWLARYPHEASTWFAYGHTIPAFDAQPYCPESRLNGAMLVLSTLLPDDAVRMRLPDGDLLTFLGVVLLYPEELEFKLTHGFGEICRRLERAGVNEVVDIHRRSVIRKNPLLKLLGRS